MNALRVRFRVWLANGNAPEFVAWNAHMFAAMMIVYFCGVHGGAVWAHRSAEAIIAWAAWKEFYFDKHYEMPEQPFSENARDFLGYTSGAVIATVLLLWRT